ncbi:MAG: LysR family transcriptional regulator [Roseovarius sp.]
MATNGGPVCDDLNSTIHSSMTGAEVNDLLVFIDVVDAGSFVAAAHRHGLSRSAPGKAVARLEARFGTRLLNRTTRALSLTDAGRTLLDHALACARLDAPMPASSAAGERGQLRIGAWPAAQPAGGAAVLDRWPLVQVEMSLSPVDAVARGPPAASVSPTRPGLLLPRYGASRRPLCASPDYLEIKGPPASVEGLCRHDLLVHSQQGQHLTWRLQDGDGTHMRVTGRTRLRLDNAEALREAALAGMGVILLPEVIVQPDIEAGRLIRLLPRAGTGTVQILAIYPHRRLLDANVRGFIDHLAAGL